MTIKPGATTRLFTAATVAALLCGVGAAGAQDGTMPAERPTGATVAPKIDAAKEKSIRELLALTGEAKRRAGNVSDSILAYFSRNAPNVSPADVTKMKSELADTAPLTEALVRSYDKNYTQADLDALIAFYKTPTGQKYLKQLPAVETDGREAEQAWGNANAERIGAYLQARPRPEAPAPKPVKPFDKKPFVGNGKPVKMKSGLAYEDMTVGTGATAVAGKTAVMHYTGTLTNGKKFDSSRDRNEPFPFRLGAGQVIKGWDEGIAGMKVGGRRKLTIPYELAYGAEGSPPTIPPEATLIFDVELMDVQ